MDATHGYHTSTLHLASRYPTKVAESSNPFKIFPKRIWLAIFITSALFCLLITNAVFIYEHLNPGLVKADVGVSRIIVRLLAGFTEPDNIGWFSRHFSTGRYLMALWFAFSFFIINIYCIDLRSKLIVPEMESPINSNDDIDFTTTKIIIDNGTYTAYLIQSGTKRMTVKFQQVERGKIDILFVPLCM